MFCYQCQETAISDPKQKYANQNSSASAHSQLLSDEDRKADSYLLFVYTYFL